MLLNKMINKTLHTIPPGLYYSWDDNTYRTTWQDEEIRKLKEQLKDKEDQRNTSIKDIIGYFYKAR